MSIDFVRREFLLGLGAAVPLAGWSTNGDLASRMQSWRLATSTRTAIHDLAPAPDGGVWFTAQASGHLGWVSPGP
ncbi:MAG: lyase, partial [Hylemonella sp.]